MPRVVEKLEKVKHSSETVGLLPKKEKKKRHPCYTDINREIFLQTEFKDHTSDK